MFIDYGRPMKPFSLKFRIFWLGQTNWADKFWGIWGIFSQTINTHFVTVSPLSIFSIIQALFLQKTKPLYPHTKYLWDWDLNLGLRVSKIRLHVYERYYTFVPCSCNNQKKIRQGGWRTFGTSFYFCMVNLQFKIPTQPELF